MALQAKNSIAFAAAGKADPYFSTDRAENSSSGLKKELKELQHIRNSDLGNCHLEDIIINQTGKKS